ncbi:MAG: hypothetical protein QOG42_361, partial [Solirubrobacteraceae bacterium]|nr:hypothetical protein [Solirubrobacteraceae bacterium]
DAYERTHDNRATITDKIAKLTGDEPWSGYDELSVDAVSKTLADADPQKAQHVKTYEAGHKARAGVIAAADKRIDRS